MLRTTSCALVLIVLLLPLAIPSGVSSVAATQTLVGSRSTGAAQALLVTSAAADTPMRLAIGLRPANEPALARFLVEVQDPSSPSYHRFLDADAFAARFGPAQADVDALVAWLGARGFDVSPVGGDRLVVDARGSVAQIETALDVRVGVYELAGARALAIDRDPTVPSALAPLIVSIAGLDDTRALSPNHSTPMLVPRGKVGSASGFAPADVAKAYNAKRLDDAGIDGSGRVIGIATAYDFKTSDLAAFDAQWNLSPPATTRVCVDGPCRFDANAGSDETTLDVEWASGTARGASLRVVEAADASLAAFMDTYHAAANDSSLGVVSTSWGLCERDMPSGVRQSDDIIFAAANARGQTWFAASGDSGSADCGGTTGVDYPASSPFVTGVGGTTLKCTKWPNCSGHGSESGWSGSGGGASSIYAKPSWQSGASVPADGARDVPDVALTADPARGVLTRFDGAWYVFGGTSEAAPQWAGLWARLEQAKNATQGNANPRLYAMPSSAFYAVTKGCNGDFCAAKGYDEVTGLGSFNASNFVTKW